MKFKKGDIVKFEGAATYAAKKGATAIVEEYYIGWSDKEYVKVKWIRDELSGEQADGGYLEHQFTKVEEVSTQKEDRIFEEIKKEKVMKFNFNEGKQRVIDMLEGYIEDFEFDMLQDIKMSIQDIDENTVDQIEDIIKTIKTNTNHCMKAIENVQNSSTVAEILASMDLTGYEGMEETVLAELFGLESITIED
jgi:archaellum component FlaC